MKIAVMGTGGLGGYIGGQLAHGGQEVIFIVRGESLRAISDKGLQVHSPRGDFLVNPIQATDKPDDVGPVDLVLFSVKSYDAENAMESMRPMVGPKTTVLPVLNGIEHVARLQAELGQERVLGGMSMINAHKGEPGVIHHVADAGQYQLEFGEWGGGISPRCEQIQEEFTGAGLNAVAVPNISERMWWKMAAFSGATVFAVMRGEKATVWTTETKALVHKTISEAMAVARAQGTPLTDTLPDDVLKLAENLPPDYKPSILVDLEQGKRLELEAITGALSRLGSAADVPTPANDFVYACLKPHAGGQQ